MMIFRRKMKDNGCIQKVANYTSCSSETSSRSRTPTHSYVPAPSQKRTANSSSMHRSVSMAAHARFFILPLAFCPCPCAPLTLVPLPTFFTYASLTPAITASERFENRKNLLIGGQRKSRELVCSPKNPNALETSSAIVKRNERPPSFFNSSGLQLTAYILIITLIHSNLSLKVSVSKYLLFTKY